MALPWLGVPHVLHEKTPRKLYFGSDMIHVHVDQVITSENGYVFKDLFNDKANGFGNQFGIQPYYSLGRDTIISRSDVFPDMWYSIILDFADLSWTNELDTLPGLSGIARMFQDVYKDDYVAGLWANDIECGLLFCVNVGKRTFQAASEHLLSGGGEIGPSWSWVELKDYFNGFVMSLAGDNLCRVRSHIRSEIYHLGIENQIDGRNPLGRVHFAALNISGTLLKISDVRELAFGVGHHAWCTMPEGQLVYMETDWSTAMAIQDEDRNKLRLLLLVSCCSEPPETIRDWVEQEHGRWRPGSTLWRESVLDRPEYRQTFYQDKNRGDNGPGRCTLCGPEHERDVWGLLIYPAAQPATYYRVGIFQSRALHGGLSIFRRHGYTDTITLV
ncbi:C6 transcription factor [Apiospora saccharicola]